MKYERLHGPLNICRGCGTRGRWLWWWNRRNGMTAHFKRMCKSCGRKSGYKFMGENINGINHGGGKSGKIYLLFKVILGRKCSSPAAMRAQFRKWHKRNRRGV